MNDEQIVKKFNKFREVCLKNAEDLLAASLPVLELGIDHASFHLSLMALEEIGKIEIEKLRVMSLLHPKGEPITLNLDTDDHQRKIFFAIWSPSMARTKQTQELFDKNKTISSNLHESRLMYLYTDTENPKNWTELMRDGEAKMIYDFVEVRLKIEAADGGLTDAHIEHDEELEWFLKAQEDKQKRGEIWGHKSQEKLLELGNVKEWIVWLKGLYDGNEQEMRELLQKEMAREEPSEEKKMDSKWRVRMEIVTPSHSIRQNAFEEFNKGNSWIKLTRKDNNTLGLEMTFPKALPVQGLWSHPWGMARMFVMSLNIATHGLFWWNIKRDASRYYTEILDIESNAKINIGANPELELNWREQRMVLRTEELTVASIMFTYVTDCWGEKKDEHLNHYVVGLGLLAKNDIHLRFEMNAFDSFFKALKTAMIANGDWDGVEPFENAYQRATDFSFPEVTEEMKKTFLLGFQVEKEHTGMVDLTSVYAMKNYTEEYFQILAIRHFKKTKGQEIRIIKGKKGDENLPSEPIN